MDGLSKNKDMNCILKKWYKLFNNNNIKQSDNALFHWKKVECIGLSNLQKEYWKYISFNHFLSIDFLLSNVHSISLFDRDTLSMSLNAFRITFVNGFFEKKLSDKNTGFWKITTSNKNNHKQSCSSPIRSDLFLHLTESLSQESTRICLPSGKIAQRPLYLLHINQGYEDKKMLSTVFYRHYFDIEDNAQGTIIEHFVSINSSGYFNGTRTSVMVGNNSCLNYIKLSFENNTSYHFSNNDIIIGNNSVVHNTMFVIGSRTTRNQINVQLNGERSKLMINNLDLLSEKNISDTSTYIEHNKKNCVSHQLHKVIVCDFSRGMFNGFIKVAKNAIKTDSKMINNNLLLDKLSKVNINPHLEVYADDVKCSHGATVGYIDEEQIFYLCSRGIDKNIAKKIIIYAFTSEIIKKIDNDVIRDTILIRMANVLKWDNKNGIPN